MKIIKISRRKKIYRTLLIVVLLYVLYFFGIFTNIYETTLQTLPNKIELENDFNDHSRNQEYKFIHTAPKTCQKAPFLLILIKSKIDNFKERLAVRKTWAQLDEYGIIKRVFLLGKPKPSHNKIAHKLNEEITIYGDIVQQDFYDGYFNNTIKTLMGIRWAIDYCLNVKSKI